MNYYEQRISQLDKSQLSIEVFSDGRDRKISNEEYWKKIKVGSKIYPTVWFLRNIPEVDLVKSIAEKGLTVIEKSHIDDSEGEWKMGSWKEKRFNCLFFEETSRPMSFKYSINQQIWKIE
jgi:hypothetical protein